MRKYNNAYYRPAAMNMVEKEGKLWMALLNRNGICEADRATRQARIRKVFEDEPLSRENLYHCVEKIGNKLVFSPCTAEKIAIYDWKNDILTYIPLKKEVNGKEEPGEAKFWNMIRFETDIYLLGYSYPAIIKINMDSMETRYITDWVKEVEENIEAGDSNGYFTDGHVICGDWACIPVGCMSAVLELNLKTAQTRIRKLRLSAKGIGGLSSVDGNTVWLVGKGGGMTNYVSRWNRRDGQIEEFRLPDQNENIAVPFFAPVCTENRIFLVPVLAPCVYEMNPDTGEIKKNRTLESLLKNRNIPSWTCWKTIAPGFSDGCLTFLTCDDLRWHEYNVITDELISYSVYCDENVEPYFDALWAEGKKADNIAVPEQKMALEYFTDKMIKKRGEDTDKEGGRLSVGKQIYRRIFAE